VADKVQRERVSNQNVRKTHCTNGHALTGENLYVRPDGKGRQCVLCQQIRNSKRAAS
jgi:hypothetical protein